MKEGRAAEALPFHLFRSLHIVGGPGWYKWERLCSRRLRIARCLCASPVLLRLVAFVWYLRSLHIERAVVRPRKHRACFSLCAP